jgi:uncharacterized membrane protein YtjA (UPF0391 family)
MWQWLTKSIARILAVVGAVLVVVGELMAIPPWTYGDKHIKVTHGVVDAISSVLFVLGIVLLIAALVSFVRARRSKLST